MSAPSNHFVDREVVTVDGSVINKGDQKLSFLLSHLPGAKGSFLKQSSS
jgi:hypothetical protein